MYPDAAKMAKQFQFAEKKGIQFAVLVGEEEIKQNQYKIKDLISGEQETVSLDQLVEKLK
jgi:histidyl-tRNA synthetase